MNLGEIWWESVDFIHLAQDSLQQKLCSTELPKSFFISLDND
jgi:hypothetical protein